MPKTAYMLKEQGKSLLTIRKVITRAECDITAGRCEWKRACIQLKFLVKTLGCECAD